MNEMSNSPKLSRRAFVFTSAAATGALIVGIDLFNDGTAGAVPADAVAHLNAFVRIDPDGSISITYACAEMGQGSSTGLPMIIADEMEADWDKVSVASAPVADAFKNPRNRQQRTGGSNSIRGWYMELRKLGAATREMLVEAAAQSWNVPAGECSARDSVVTHTPSGKTLRYGEVAALAATLTPPQNPRLKNESEFKLIGHPTMLKDMAPKVNGSAKYGIDVILPGMLFADVRFCPTFGGDVASYDDSAARTMSGFHAVVAVPGGIAVVADTYWQARQALEKIDLEYDPGANAGQSSARISAELRKGLNEVGAVARDDGDVQRALDGAATVLEATYEVPYLAHATMEPMNCTADVREDGCEIWAPTQDPQDSRKVAAELLGLPLEKVEVHTMLMGGGFGRRGNVDYVEQAVTVSKAIGRPVKLIWSREEDMRHDFYRPTAVVRLVAGLDAGGVPVAFDVKVAAPSIYALLRPAALRNGIDRHAVIGFNDHPYAIASNHVEWVRKDLGIPVGFWRSVGHSHNPFMRESFIDEMAFAAGRDAYEFRRSLLKNSPRHLRVLDVAAKAAGWGKTLPANHGMGLSVVKAYGSWLSQVAEVSVEGDRVKVHRVTCAVDCGVAINPLTIKAQVEGAIVYGLTAALKGDITIEDGGVVESNFHDYEMLRIDEMPEIDVHIIEGGDLPGGVGEPGTPPIAPAVTNAIFNATGQRIRSLPISKYSFGVT